MINTTGIVIIIVFGSLVVIGITLLMLNRSWGDFPRRAGMPPDVGTSAPGRSSPPVVLPPGFGDDVAGEEEKGTKQGDNRIPITHPMIRRAAKSALYQNSSHARYLVREGDQLFFVFDRIPDPQQRQQAVDLMRRFQSGQHVDMGEIFRLLALLDKG